MGWTQQAGLKATALCLALCALVAGGCVSTLGASVETHAFPATRQGALDAIALAQAQPGAHRVLNVAYRPEAARPTYLWDVANGLADADLSRCEVYRPWVCADRLRVDVAHIIRLEGTSKPPLGVTRLAPGADLVAAARELQAEAGDHVLLARYPAEGSARGAVEQYAWAWAPLDARLSILTPDMLCVSTEKIHSQGCQAYEDVRAIDLVALEPDGAGGERRVHRAFEPTHSGAQAALAELKREDGRARFVHVEIPRRILGTDQPPQFGANFTGVTRLDATGICGGRTESLVDELCFRFDSVASLTVMDWRATSEEVLGTVLGLPFRLVAGALSPA